MALTVDVTRDEVTGRQRKKYADVTFDSSYPRGGEALAPGALGLSTVANVEAEVPGIGWVPAYDAANEKLKLLAKPSPVGITRTIDDDDDAASNGVAVYVHVATQTADVGRQVGPSTPVEGWLEFVSPTNADGSFTLSNGDVIPVFDDDNASSSGVQVYVDEDEATVSPIQANIATLLRDVIVRTRGGAYVLISHDASAASNGVALYFDEDAADASKLQFVSPTNANATVTVDPEITPTAVATGVTAKLVAFGY